MLRYSPCGQWDHRRSGGTGAVTIDDVLHYLNSNENAEYYDGEIEYLLQYCKRKCLEIVCMVLIWFLIKDLSVRSNSANRTIGYTIHGFGKSASTQTFIWAEKNNELITVENYFKKRYGTELRLVV